MIIPRPNGSPYEPWDPTWLMEFVTLGMGVLFLGLYLYGMSPLGKTVPELLRWWKDPRRKLLKRVTLIAPADIDKVVPGDLAAITGRLVSGEGAVSWKLTGRLVLEDAFGRRVQVGEGEVAERFEAGETVFAVGVLRRPVEGGQLEGGDPYRSAAALDVVVPAPDGLFFVAKGPRERALRDLEQAAAPPRLPPSWLAIVGAVSLLLGLGLLFR